MKGRYSYEGLAEVGCAVLQLLRLRNWLGIVNGA
jgi:hypothetical protein